MRKLYIIAPLLFLGLLWGCKNVKDPEFRRIDHFRLKNIGLADATIGMNITYYNPNNFNVTVKEAQANVYIDSIFLGNFVQDSSVFVGKEAEFSIPISATIPLQTALKINYQHLGSREISIKADGSVKVGKSGFFVNRAIHYAGVHRLDELNFK